MKTTLKFQKYDLNFLWSGRKIYFDAKYDDLKFFQSDKNI